MVRERLGSESLAPEHFAKDCDIGRRRARMDMCEVRTYEMLGRAITACHSRRWEFVWNIRGHNNFKVRRTGQDDMSTFQLLLARPSLSSL